MYSQFMMDKNLLLLTLVLFLLASCGPGGDADNVTPTTTPTVTASLTGISTPIFTPTVTSTQTAIFTLTPIPTPTNSGSIGEATISGWIGYPSEGWCPEMNLYVRNTTDERLYVENWNTGECEFSITIPAPGQYILFAWPVGMFSNLGFIYSDDCISPEEINIRANETIADIRLMHCRVNVPRP
jgi:hypothetical protein